MSQHLCRSPGMNKVLGVLPKRKCQPGGLCLVTQMAPKSVISQQEVAQGGNCIGHKMFGGFSGSDMALHMETRSYYVVVFLSLSSQRVPQLFLDKVKGHGRSRFVSLTHGHRHRHRLRHRYGHEDALKHFCQHENLISFLKIY